MSQTLYLASKSPRRAELLRQIGVDFKVVDIDVPEVHNEHESPREYVSRLALDKALAGKRTLLEQLPVTQSVVLGSDTIVTMGSCVLEKPENQQEGADMLASLSGMTHQVMTAVAIVQHDKVMADVSITDVTFREITGSEIAEYWSTGEPIGKAGGYAIQGYGAVFVDKIVGSYSGVVGLPIEAVATMLRHFHIPCWQGQP